MTTTASPYFIESFTPEEHGVLTRFFTNVDAPVFAVVNLPEVVKGALFARYSRSPKSVRRLFLDEFYEAPELGLATVADQLAASDPTVNLTSAERLYDRVFSQYGDDSVAQLGAVHLACEQSSNILTKVLEWGRLTSYLEQSTRYIYFDKQLGGNYRYHTPHEILGTPHEAKYKRLMTWLFTTYASLIPPVRSYYETLNPRHRDDSEMVWNSIIRASTCDDLRGLLPASTISNVGIFGSGQAYEMMLIRMRVHPLSEARSYANMMLAELRKVIPSFMKRVDLADRGGAWSGYLSGVAESMTAIGSELTQPVPYRPEVTLVDFDPEAEVKLAAAALYPYTDLPDDVLLARARTMSVKERTAIIKAYVGDRNNRRHKPGRAMERSDYRFDVLCDYGIFRDLQRHRLLTVDWQKLSPTHGYVTPDSVVELAAAELWDEAMDRTHVMYNALAADFGNDVAQYAIPLAYRIRFFFQMNAREAFHMLELRTQQGGHPDYRRVCQEMHALIRDQAGHRAIADSMHFVDHTDHGLARLESERRAEARRVDLDNDQT